MIARTKTLNWVGLACETASSGTDFQNAVFNARRWPSWDQPSCVDAAPVPPFAPSFQDRRPIARSGPQARLVTTANRWATNHIGTQGGLRHSRGQSTSSSIGRPDSAPRRSSTSRDRIPSRRLAVPVLSPSLTKQLQTVSGFPVLKRGMECSIPDLHFRRQARSLELWATSRFCFWERSSRRTELVCSIDSQ